MTRPSSNDCFVPGDGTMTLAEALDRLAGKVDPIDGTETVPLRQAAGRLLAEDVIAPRDVPPHDNSAVDGYAVFHEALSDAGTTLPIGGRIPAGHLFERAGRTDEALRIFTGAPVPDGPDTIVMQEDCAEEDGDVVIRKAPKKGANLRKRGEDVREGDVIIAAGSLLRPQEVGLAASVGKDELLVKRRLRAAVFSTGDEVRDPSGDAPAGCIFDVNRFTVMALLEGLGCEVTDLGILPDDLDTITKALDEGRQGQDVLLTSGGVSLGDEDHVKAAVERLGALHFWKLAIKPGRPIALGAVGETAFVGLPGNPVAAMVTFMRIARPVLLGLMGRKDLDPVSLPVPAGFAMKKKAGRREWLRARLVARDGRTVAEKYHSEGSGILTSMVFADGLIELPEDCDGVAEGQMIDFLPFNEVTR